MKWTKPVLSLLAAGALTATSAAAAAAEPQFAAPPLAPAVSEGGTLPIAKSEKVYSGTAASGDWAASSAHIAIYADLDESGQPIRWRISQDGATRFALMQGAEVAFAKTPAAKLEDVNGDGEPELLIYRKGAGANQGALGLGIYEVFNRYLPLYDVTDPSFTDPELERRYELDRDPSGGIRFKDPVSGLAAVLHGGTAGEARVEPVSKYDIGDLDGDGVKEITAVQRIVAASSADAPAVALLKTRYKLMYGAYSPVVQSLEDTAGKVFAKIAIPEY
ncbi:hypothetical protein [Cohnella sp. JJ-181]|uniref:hypothetical protein n=1 Tax=Cohnella rhizoplanae TaxID=2974897 RepID=UPI0022FF6A58|nr:hypothetical protein [Cohnella sp. JJ-181]CAI6086984.1 hypothetical protein COHCIP112018_05271 [Cohnella sp. JJ-181]